MLVDAIVDRVCLNFVVFHVHGESEGRKETKEMATIAVGEGKLQENMLMLSWTSIHVSKFLKRAELGHLSKR